MQFLLTLSPDSTWTIQPASPKPEGTPIPSTPFALSLPEWCAILKVAQLVPPDFPADHPVLTVLQQEYQKALMRRG